MDLLLNILTSAHPYIGLWLLAAGLDLLFGGPKALSIVPGLETLITGLLRSADTYVSRYIRSSKILSVSGFCFSALLFAGLAAFGVMLDIYAFGHPALLALAVVLVARSVGMKRQWSELSQAASSLDDAELQRAISRLVQQFAFRHAGAFLAFFTFGFTGLWPYLLLLATWDAKLFEPLTLRHSLKPDTGGVTSFASLARLFARPVLSVAGIFGAFVLMSALVFKPKTHWGKAILALTKPSFALMSRPLLVMAAGHNWSLITITPDTHKPTWVGTKTGRAKLTPKDLADALIVTLVAFSVLNGFLLLTWLAVASR